MFSFIVLGTYTPGIVDITATFAYKLYFCYKMLAKSTTFGFISESKVLKSPNPSFLLYGRLIGPEQPVMIKCTEQEFNVYTV